jgi:hypothetical protein
LSDITFLPEGERSFRISIDAKRIEAEKVVQALQNEAFRGKVKFIIGVAPVGVDFGQKIGADTHGRGAAEAATLAIRLVAASLRDTKDRNMVL